eukprot:Lankesteria_metandrocarpae@DN5331_c0_g1_i1.p1
MKFVSVLSVATALIAKSNADTACPSDAPCLTLGGYGMCFESVIATGHECRCNEDGVARYTNEPCPLSGACSGNPCAVEGATGYCSDETKASDFKCYCDGAWLAMNETCKLAADCADNKCDANGDAATCAVVGGATKCTCSDGTVIAGDKSCPLVASCKNNPCDKYGATGYCAQGSTAADYVCECANERMKDENKACPLDDACKGNKCSSNGDAATCSVIAGLPMCTCSTHTTMSTDKDYACPLDGNCVKNNCGSHGKCSSKEAGGYTCHCDDGTTTEDGTACKANSGSAHGLEASVVLLGTALVSLAL